MFNAKGEAIFEGVVWLISLGDLNEIIAKDCESLDYEKLVSYIDGLICASSDWKIIKKDSYFLILKLKTYLFLSLSLKMKGSK